MSQPRFVSLELNWLPNSFLKGLSLPSIAFVEDYEYGGAYWHNRNHIDVKAGDSDLLIASSLAHEMRHHWQHLQGWPPIVAEWDLRRPYWEMLVEYFSYSPKEYDALRFEMKVAPSDVAAEWVVALQKAGKGLFAF